MPPKTQPCAAGYSGWLGVGTTGVHALGDNDRAYDLAGRSILASPSNARAHATLAAIDALAGHRERAAIELAAFQKVWPASTVNNYDELYRSADPVYLKQRERLYEGLRVAGLPER